MTGRVIEATTDENGYCKIQNLACDVYVINIKESNDFRKDRKVVNLIEMRDKDQPMEVNFTLKRQDIGFLTVMVR